MKVLGDDSVLEGQHRANDARYASRPLCVANYGLDRPDSKLFIIGILGEQSFRDGASFLRISSLRACTMLEHDQSNQSQPTSQFLYQGGILSSFEWHDRGLVRFKHTA
jgi:hypothetical protein